MSQEGQQSTGVNDAVAGGYDDVGLFEHLPVLTVLTTVDDSGEEVIDDCNDRFARRLGRTRSELCEQPLRSVYASDTTPLDVESDDPADGGSTGRYPESDGGSVPIGTAAERVDTGRRSDRSGPPEYSIGGPRPFRFPVTCVDGSECDPESVFTLVGADGHLIQTVAEALPRADGEGHIVVHVDVTRQQRREWQAGVLNRLMRHNVRNDMNILRGHASALTEHEDEEVVEAAEVIDRVADRWLGLAETVRDIERLFDEVPVETAALGDVADSARRTVKEEWPESRVDIEMDVDPERRVSERLHVALVELCENGIKHAGEATAEDEVRVTIEESVRPEWIAVHVADEGPGIPAHELSALHVDEETPLQHGSGLGFWLVRFIVRRLGGQISARNRDDGGSVVSLHLPLAEGR